MSLPYADEIRALRASLETAQRAHQALAPLEALRVSLAILADREGFAPETLPGADLLSSLSESWPELEDLWTGDPPHGITLRNAIAARRAQVDLAIATLRPLAEDAHDFGHQLQHLQEHQALALEAPEFASVVAELQALNARRNSAQSEINPLAQQLAVLHPITSVGGSFRTRIVDALNQATGAIPAYSAALMATGCCDALNGLMTQVHLQLSPLVVVPMPPFSTDEPEELWRSIATDCIGRMDALIEAVSHREGAVQGEYASLNAVIEQTTRAIRERIG